MNDVVFATIAAQRCPERIEALLGVLPEHRREAVKREFDAVVNRSREEAGAMLSRMSSEAAAQVRAALMARWGRGFAACPRALQRWLAARYLAGV